MSRTFFLFFLFFLFLFVFPQFAKEYVSFLDNTLAILPKMVYDKNRKLFMRGIIYEKNRKRYYDNDPRERH